MHRILRLRDRVELIRHDMFGGPVSGQHSRAEGGGGAHIAGTAYLYPREEEEVFISTSFPIFMRD